MTLEDFAAFVRSALFLDQPDPVRRGAACAPSRSG